MEAPVRKSTEPRDHILNVAEQVFAEEGFAATSMRQLADRAGVNVATLYYHCGDKEQLFKAIYGRVVERMMSYVQGRFAGGKAFDEVAGELVDLVVEYFVSNPSVPPLLIRSTLGEVPGFDISQRETFGPLFELVAAQLNTQMDAGEMRRVDPGTFVMTAASVVLNLSLRTVRDSGEPGESGERVVPPEALRQAQRHARYFILGAVGLPIEGPDDD